MLCVMCANTFPVIFKIAVAVQATFNWNYNTNATILSRFFFFELTVMGMIGKHQQNCD